MKIPRSEQRRSITGPHWSNKISTIFLSLFVVSIANASETPAYVDGDMPFETIADVNQQAENWAVCAASYDIMSTIMAPEAPARARQLSDLGSGARVALGISLVMNDLEPDISPERFNTLWANSEAAMAEWPQAQLYSILADAEGSGIEGGESFGKKLNATVVICINNLAAQRKHVETWIELAESGLIKPSEN